MIQEYKFCLMLEEMSSPITFTTLRNPNSKSFSKEEELCPSEGRKIRNPCNPVRLMGKGLGADSSSRERCTKNNPVNSISLGQGALINSLSGKMVQDNELERHLSQGQFFGDRIHYHLTALWQTVRRLCSFIPTCL